MLLSFLIQYKNKQVKLCIKQKTPKVCTEGVLLKNWHRHTLPGFRPSTICAGGLNFSVRNGKR